MLEKIKDITRSILEEKQADGVLGLIRGQWNIIQPHVFDNLRQVDHLVLEPKWLLAKMAMTVLRSSAEGYRLAVIARGCDERALTELVKRNQMEKDRLLSDNEARQRKELLLAENPKLNPDFYLDDYFAKIKCAAVAQNAAVR